MTKILFGELVLGITESQNETTTHKKWLMDFILVTHLADSNNLRLLFFFPLVQGWLYNAEY